MKIPFFYRDTDGIRITVRPVHLSDQSDPEGRQFVFAYFVRIENTREETVQLLSRRWLIHDSTGEDSEVAGDGVVGEQPVLAPGAVHDYQSFCVLKSAHGTMEGQYHFMKQDGHKLTAQIPKFILDATADAGWN